MNSKDTQRWQAIEELFDAAMERSPDEREAYVKNQCAEDPALAERVLALLKAEQAAGDFLESGPDTQQPEEFQSVRRIPQQRQIGPWQLKELLGRGGMGEVYRAERADGQYQHTVALKLIHNEAAKTSRFEDERQILASLNHPNIARLIDGGLSEDGQPYMAMEYVDGLSLSEYLKQADLNIEQRLQLFLSICEAIAYAHANLVVHRDIKPENILIDRDGKPRILDFGIAKLTRPGLDNDQTQAVATPNYCAPEQLTGGRITTAADIYSLGATLYFMLCSRPPVNLENASLPQLLDRLQHQTPPPPSRFSTDLKGQSDLDAICMKALAKEPEQRYRSVQSLAADIQRFLDHEPVAAMPPSLLYRLRRYIRKHRLSLSAISLIFLSLTVGLGVAAWQANEASIQRDQARRDAARVTTMQSAMMQLFRSAASQGDGDKLTARELFHKSAQQIEQDFHADPALAVRLMQMLGELLLTTEDFAAAQKLLLKAESRYQPDMPHSLLASILTDLAHIDYRDDNLQQAKQRHERALQIWQQEPERYRAELIWSATLASQLARAEGQSAEAVFQLEQAAQLAQDHWGFAHEETGIVLINLAVAHYYNADLPAALDACAKAWQVWQAINKTESPDALNLLGNWGLFAMRHGDPLTGEKRLAEAMELRSKLYGPSAALATLMKNLGVAHRINGRVNAGMRLLEQSVWMAEKYAGTGGRLHSSAVFALARALLEDGKDAEAKQLLQAQGATNTGKASPWHHLNTVLLASLQEPTQETEALFSTGLDALQSLGKGGGSHYADGLQYYSQWLQKNGQLEAALNNIRLAHQQKVGARHSQHYESLLIKEQEALILYALGDTNAAKAMLDQIAEALSQQFGQQHPLYKNLQALAP